MSSSSCVKGRGIYSIRNLGIGEYGMGNCSLRLNLVCKEYMAPGRHCGASRLGLDLSYPSAARGNGYLVECFNAIHKRIVYHRATSGFFLISGVLGSFFEAGGTGGQQAWADGHSYRSTAARHRPRLPQSSTSGWPAHVTGRALSTVLGGSMRANGAAETGVSDLGADNTSYCREPSGRDET